MSDNLGIWRIHGNLRDRGLDREKAFVFPGRKRLVEECQAVCIWGVHSAFGKKPMMDAIRAARPLRLPVPGGHFDIWLVGYVYLNGQLLAQYKNSTTYFVHKDHLGSTRLMTRLDRSVYDSLDYLPYGEQVAGDTGTTHKFTGHERDAESGFDYMKARHFASSLGRFPQPDSIAFSSLTNPQSLNLYAYVLNNPLRYIDPTGHEVSSGCGGWSSCGMTTGGPLPAASWQPSSDIPDGIIIFGNVDYRPGSGIYYYYPGGSMELSLLDAYLGHTATSPRRPKPKLKAPPNSRTDVVLIGANTGQPQQYGALPGLWIMDWTPREVDGNDPAGNVT